MLNYASAAASSPFRNIIAHKPVVPSDKRKKERGKRKSAEMAEKREKRTSGKLVPCASIKRIAERSISLIISEKGGTGLFLVPLSPRDADGAAKLIFKRDSEASVRGVRSAL